MIFRHRKDANGEVLTEQWPSFEASNTFLACYTVAALVFEELIQRHDSGVSFFGLGNPWESRTEKTHEIWGVAIRRALARTAISEENPGGDGYCLFLPRESADQPCA
jgi:hypothetical protein